MKARFLVLWFFLSLFVIYQHSALAQEVDTTPPTGSVAINGNATYTNSQDVTLTLSADDTSGVVSMRIANYTSYHAPQPYATSTPWSLTAGDGLKEVRVKFTDGVGNENSPGILTTITLDTVSPTGTVTINGGAQYTNSRDVTLTLSSADGTSGISNIVGISNESEDPLIQSYLASRTWTLSSGDGLKIVNISFRDNAGNESSASSTITLDTTAPTITIANPDTDTAYSKTVTASTNDGTLMQSVTSDFVCDSTLVFVDYSDATFDSPLDNGKRVCYKAADTLGNTSYSISQPISGIITPTKTSSRSGGGGGVRTTILSTLAVQTPAGEVLGTTTGKVLGVETVSPMVQDQILQMKSKLASIIQQLIVLLQQEMATIQEPSQL